MELCHVLTFISFVLSLFSMVRAWVGVGSLCFFYFCVWPDMVLNQRQLFIVVPDWDPYLGNLGFTVGLWVFVSCVSVCATRDCFVSISHCYFVFVSCSVFSIKTWTLTTLCIGPILATPLKTKRRKSAVTVILMFCTLSVYWQWKQSSYLPIPGLFTLSLSAWFQQWWWMHNQAS